MSVGGKPTLSIGGLTQHILRLGLQPSTVAYTLASTVCLTVAADSDSSGQSRITVEDAVLVLTRKQLVLFSSDLQHFTTLPVEGIIHVAVSCDRSWKS